MVDTDTMHLPRILRSAHIQVVVKVVGTELAMEAWSQERQVLRSAPQHQINGDNTVMQF